MAQTASEPKPVRCAIYTRKSTQEGLDADFTTLDAQRESGLNYIASQKSQGWIALSEKYDDGGFTGANIDRPALKRLLHDISDGKIDCVVVYKVDRLSRSLLDFTRLLELFEQHNVTFVSVTQHFNTNNSMGRLTLNILLSFAQFEREMISERTADKIGAARRKGRYTGGRPALGYNADKENHALVINSDEADLVRSIFDLYVREQSLSKVAEKINANGHRTKKHSLKSGKAFGGKPFTKTSVQWIIRNILYTGKVSYKNEIYDGMHEAIISDETFKKAAAILKANSHTRSSQKRKKHQGLFSQLIFCHACGKMMFYTYAKKKNRHYKYYVCQTATKQGYKSCPTRMIAARHIEQPIISLLNIKNWKMLLFEEQRQKIIELVKKIEVNRESSTLIIESMNGTTERIGMESERPLINKKKLFNELPVIKQHLLLAHQIQQILDSGKAKNIKEISEWTGLSTSRLHQIMAFLSLCPSIQEAIISEENFHNIPEYKIRSILKESDPEIQLSLWKKL